MSSTVHSLNSNCLTLQQKGLLNNPTILLRTLNNSDHQRFFNEANICRQEISSVDKQIGVESIHSEFKSVKNS